MTALIVVTKLSLNFLFPFKLFKPQKDGEVQVSYASTVTGEAQKKQHLTKAKPDRLTLTLLTGKISCFFAYTHAVEETVLI